MTAIAAAQHTGAVVVAELRAEDALHEFLEVWIELGWGVWNIVGPFGSLLGYVGGLAQGLGAVGV
jgi:hypothetical protein